MRAAGRRGAWRPLLLGAGLVGWVAAQQPMAPAAGGQVLLHETFDDNHRGWLVDDYSRIEGGAYVIDAQGQGGYYRWLAEPGELSGFTCEVTVRKLRGGNTGPLFGLLFRVQGGWQNSYFFVINGASGYMLGKFVEGSAVPLKQGTSTAIHPAEAANTLTVRANGSAFGLLANGEPIANVADETFPAGGSVGVCAEAPAMVRFDELTITSLPLLQGRPTAGGPPPAPAKTLYEDGFEATNGWAEDGFRSVSDGAYHLHNEGEKKSYVSWQPATEKLSDFVARIDVRALRAEPNTLYGICWRVRDGANYHFFVISLDGRFYAGSRLDGEVLVHRTGRSPAVRPGQQANTLEVRAERNRFQLALNGVEACTFLHSALPTGCIGVYLEQPGHVAFDNLLVTDLPENAPPVVGGATSAPAPVSGGDWLVGPEKLHDPLDRNGRGFAWPEDEFHKFDQGGYCVRAPEHGSRTTLNEATLGLTDGSVTVNVRAIQGPVQSGYGLVFRANQAVDSFYFLLLNSGGRYFVGKCVDNEFQVLDAGPVAYLHGGDLGNDLQVTAEGSEIKYGVNDQYLGSLRDATLGKGAVGLHVEHGVVACFRDLKVYDPAPGGPGEG